MSPTLEDLEKELSVAESTADIAALTAQILGVVAAHSEMSAKQLKDAKGGLPAIAGNISGLGSTTIAGRGDSNSPVYIRTGDGQALSVTLDQNTATVISNFLAVINDIVCVKANVDKLIKVVEYLQDQYKNHHHKTERNHTDSGPPLPVFKPISFDPEQSSSSGKAD
jgi:hypothetical protein